MIVMLLASGVVAWAAVNSINSVTNGDHTLSSDFGNISVVSSSSALSHKLKWNGALPVSKGGTGMQSFTNGSILFYSSGASLSQDNSNLFWDNTTKRLGIGANTPTSEVNVNGTIEATVVSTNSIVASGSNQSLSLSPTGTGTVNIGGNSLIVARLTDESQIASASTGQIYFDRDIGKFRGYDGVEWETFAFMASPSTPTTILSDNFNRSNAGSWGTASGGGAWTGINSGSAIASNVGTITASAAEVRGDYHDLSQQNDLVITFDSPNFLSVDSGDIRYVMVKANGGNRDGFGLEISTGTTNNLTIRDSTTFPIAQANFTFTNGSNYTFEIGINADESVDVRVWLTSGSRPENPTFSAAAGSRTGAGNKFQIGNNGDSGGGDVWSIDNLVVQAN